MSQSFLQRQSAPAIEPVRKRFITKFGRTDTAPVAFFAPGRVNLIGEHTDYTGGLCFPCAIDSGTLLLIRRTGTGQYRFASTNFDLMAQLEGDELAHTYGDNWINYPLGVLDQFRQRGIELDGVDCLFSGNVPNGAGLSSSASIEVVTAFAINELFGCELPLIELVKMAQRAENEFVGMQCGILDQLAVAMCRADHGLLLDCHDLALRQVPLTLGHHAIVLTNTNQRRELNESAYNQRVAECQRALDLLQPFIGIDRLGALEPDSLEAHTALFDDDPIALSRARHLAGENHRVRSAVPTLEAGNLEAFGQLMYASHASLRDLFEVSSEPLDTLVKLATDHPGVLGSRLTGAGFGGCTLSLVARDQVERFRRTIGAAYEQATGLTADFYVTGAADGVRCMGPESMSTTSERSS